MQEDDRRTLYRVRAWMRGNCRPRRRDQTSAPKRPAITSPIPGGRNSDAQAHTVILIHGIRTTALWQNSIRTTLEDEGFKVQPTNYGSLDLLRFLFPGPFFRRSIVDNITNQIRHTIRLAGDTKCSIIAHSFGTFVVASMLRRYTDLEFRRIIFCGSVVPRNFPFEEYSFRFQQPLINEVGTKDVWPVLAETANIGYGSAGTYGFFRVGVRDRWHNGADHSAFLRPDFCKKFRVTFLRDGDIVYDKVEAESPPLWLWFVTRVQPRLVIAIIALFFVGWLLAAHFSLA